MKKSLILLLCSIPLTLLGQRFPIPAPGAIWDNTIANFWDTPIPLESIQRFEYNGDTVINSLEYGKLYRTWHASYYRVGLCDFMGLNPTQGFEYYCAIRSDVNNRVYLIRAGDTSEILIYDFSVSIGDSMHIINSVFDSYAHIINIDSMLIAGNYRKTFEISGGYYFNDFWIEGIGSTLGLFATSSLLYPEFTDYYLTCYQENNIPIYIASSDECSWCTLVTNLKNLSNEKKIIIEPNPVISESIIRCSSYISPMILSIYNLVGAKVFQAKISNSDQISIHREDFTAGLYILEIVDNCNRSYHERFIVQ